MFTRLFHPSNQPIYPRLDFVCGLTPAADNYAESCAGDMMKIHTIIIHVILCLMLMMLIAGCSASRNDVSTLWQERQIEDDWRLYGNPYASLNRQSYLKFYATF
jgi:hypothetical protein